MIASRGFSLTDLIATTTLCILGGAILIAMAPEPRGAPPITYSNLRVIGQAAAEYQADHTNRLPLVVTYNRGTTQSPGSGSLEGWCTWSFGGKNNHSYWAGQAFDVEAADRPLNAYLFDEPFYAPARPGRLPGNHPARLQDQAPMFRDPGDIATHQRSWPQSTPNVTAYNDIGTSYQANMYWWSQLPQNLPFEARFNEGVRRIAAGEGVHPSRFVWLSDELSSIILYNGSRNFRITNGYGDVNFAPMLVLDGHVLYHHITPTIPSTSSYTFRFEP